WKSHDDRKQYTLEQGEVIQRRDQDLPPRRLWQRFYHLLDHVLRVTCAEIPDRLILRYQSLQDLLEPMRILDRAFDLNGDDVPIGQGQNPSRQMRLVLPRFAPCS